MWYNYEVLKDKVCGISFVGCRVKAEKQTQIAVTKEKIIGGNHEQKRIHQSICR